MKNLKLTFIFTLVIVLLSLGAVAASEVSEDSNDLNINTDDFDENLEITSHDIISTVSDESGLDNNFVSDNSDYSCDNAVADNSHVAKKASKNSVLKASGDVAYVSDYDELRNVANNFNLNGGGTIILTSDLVYTTDPVSISSNINLNGNNHKITTNPPKKEISTIFSVTETGNFYISNITFTEITAKSEGVIVNKGTSIVENVKFYNNTGMVTTDGGCAAISSYNEITVKNCQFVNQKSNSGHGGAIFIDEGTALIENNTFTKCSAKQNGGAFYCLSGDIIIRNNTFNDNYVTANQGLRGYGGAIGIVHGSLHSAPNVLIDNNTFINNTAPYGGAVYINSDDSIVNLKNNTFINNTGCYMGGALYTASDFNLSVKSNEFIGNKVQQTTASADYFVLINQVGAIDTYGGAIFSNSNSKSIDIIDNSFTENYAANGGGIYIVETNANISFNRFDSNYVTPQSVETTNKGTRTYGDAMGADIVMDSTDNNYVINFNNNTLKNSKGSFGASIAISEYVLNSNNNSFENISLVDNSRTTKDIKTQGYGIIYNTGFWTSTNDTVKNSRSTFGIIMNYGEIIFDNVTIFNNTVDGPDVLYGNPSTIYNYNGNIEINNSNISKNNHTNTGSHTIYNTVNGLILINNTAIEHNIAKTGGAIYSLGSFNITYSNITNNSATSGGALFISVNSVASVINNTFTNNTATGSDTWVIFIVATNQNTKIIDNVFINNTNVQRDMLFSKRPAEVQGNEYNNNYLKDTLSMDNQYKDITMKYADEISFEVEEILRDAYNDTVRNGTVKLYIKGEDESFKEFDLKDGKATVTLTGSDLKAAVNDIVLRYESLEHHYQNDETELKITLTDIPTNITILTSKNPIIIGETENITIKLTDVFGNPLEYDLDVKINNVPVDNVKTNSSGEYLITKETDTLGVNNITASFAGSDPYKSNDTKKSFNVIKSNSTINVTDADVVYGNPVKATVKYTNASGFEAKVYDTDGNEISTAQIEKNGNEIIITNLDAGNYILNVTTTVDETRFNSNSNTSSITVRKAKSSVNVEDSSSVYGSPAVLSMESEHAGDVTVKIYDKDGNEVTATADVSDDLSEISISGLDAGIYTVKVSTVAENDNYESDEDTAKLEVKKADSTIKVNDKTVTYSEIAEMDLSKQNVTDVNVKIYDENNNDVTDKAEITVNENSISVSGLNAGTYTVNITGTKNSNYNPCNDSAKLEIRKANSTVVVADSEFTYGDKISVEAETENATGIKAVLLDKDKNPIETEITIDGNKITIAQLDAGEYYIQTTTKVNKTNYNDNTTTSKLTIKKADSTITVSDNVATYGETAKLDLGKENVTDIKIKILDENNNDVTDKAEITVNENSISVSGLNAGTYTVNVTGSKDTNYNPSSDTAKLEIKKANSTVAVKDADVVYNTTVKVTVNYENATGIENARIIDENGHEVNSADININGDEITITGLDAGNYILNVTNKVDTVNYLPNHNTSSIIVRKAKSNVTLEDTSSRYGSDAIMNLKAEDATGVTVEIFDKNGINITEKATVNVADDLSKITISGLDAGNYSVKVSSIVDKNHESDDSIADLKISKADSSVKVNDLEFTYGEEISVEAETENTTGIKAVLLDKDKNPIETEITIDGNKIIIPQLDAGEYYIQTTTKVNKNYNDNTTTSKLTIKKADSTITLNDVKSIYGETAELNLTKQNVTDVTVTVYDENNVNVTENAKITVSEESIIISGLNAGTYTVNVTGSNDSNHNPCRASARLEVMKINSTVDVPETESTYGEPAKVTVEIENATEISVKIFDDDNNPVDADVKIENSTIIITGLNAGNYTLEVTTKVNETNFNTYTGLNKLTVKKDKPLLKIITEDISYGDDEIITLKLSDNVTGTVNITVNDIEYTNVPITDGVVNLPVADLPAGDYKVKVTYNGDNNYKTVDGEAEFHIGKVTPVITIEVADIYCGEIEYLNVTVNAPGTVNITVNNVTVTVDLNNGNTKTLFRSLLIKYDGKASWDLENLAEGKYPAYAVYNGNENYATVDTNDTFNVIKRDTAVTGTGHDITTTEDETIVVDNLPEDATGNVTITIDGKNYTSTVKDGKAKFTISDLSEGEKTVSIHYSGDEKYNPSEYVTSFTVSKQKPDSSINSANIVVGDDENIEVTLPEDATGNVTITVNGINYTQELTNGKAVFNIPGLKAGEYSIILTYSGDDKYFDTTNMERFKVTKQKPDISTDSIEIHENEKGNIVVTVPKDAKGVVTLTIDGKKYTATISNGKAEFSISGLAPGQHEISASYSGDGKYYSANTKGYIKVSTNEKEKINKTINDKKGKESKAVTKHKISAVVDNHNTGNPIAALLIFITILGFVPIRRFK